MRCNTRKQHDGKMGLSTESFAELTVLWYDWPIACIPLPLHETQYQSKSDQCQEQDILLLLVASSGTQAWQHQFWWLCFGLLNPVCMGLVKTRASLEGNALIHKQIFRLRDHHCNEHGHPIILWLAASLPTSLIWCRYRLIFLFPNKKIHLSPSEVFKHFHADHKGLPGIIRSIRCTNMVAGWDKRWRNTLVTLVFLVLWKCTTWETVCCSHEYHEIAFCQTDRFVMVPEPLKSFFAGLYFYSTLRIDNFPDNMDAQACRWPKPLQMSAQQRLRCSFPIAWFSLYPELLLSFELLGTIEIVESLLLLSHCTRHHTELLLPSEQTRACCHWQPA